MEVPEVTYLEIGSHSGPEVSVNDMKALIKLIRDFGAQSVFLEKGVLEGGAITTRFMVYHDGLMYTKNGWGFRTLSDYLDGEAKGYFGSSRYYVIENDAIMTPKESYHASSSDGDLYYYLTACGFKGFAEFVGAYQKGFVSGLADEDRHQQGSRPTPDLYRKAMAKGLPDYAAYGRYQYFIRKMKEAGFTDEEEYKTAKRLGLTTPSQYKDYLALKMMKETYNLNTFQAAHLLLIVSGIPPGESVGLNEIVSKLEEGCPEVASYDEDLEGFGSPSWSPIQPKKWYTEEFQYREQIEVWLGTNPNIKDFGRFSRENRSLERNSKPNPFEFGGFADVHGKNRHRVELK